MALYEMGGERLDAIAPTTFTQLGFLERQNIQRSIRAQIGAITPNVKTMVLAEEFGEWVGANRRIDLLCLDEHANLVVVELKRDEAAHMELQALRYAAMISTMRFDQAVEAHRKYLESIGSSADSEQAIREFLELDDEEPVSLSDKVRIVLASAEFSTELTTAVLWLNKQGLDLRCVQMRPHRLGDKVVLDIQQIIPLPEVEQYQVAVREKSLEQEAARIQNRDLTRYDLFIGEHTHGNLAKRRLMLGLVAEAFNHGMSITQIAAVAPWRGNMFISADGNLNQVQFLSLFTQKKVRYFTEDGELFHAEGRTYALSKMWGHRTLEAVDNLIALMPLPERINYSPTQGISSKFNHTKLSD